VHINSLGSNVYAGGLYNLTPGAADRSYVNDGEIKSNKVTWRGGFDADIGRGLLYGSVASGYKEAALATAARAGLQARTGDDAGRALQLCAGRSACDLLPA
jgi:iron complex outermembrane receptor protein